VPGILGRLTRWRPLSGSLGVARNMTASPPKNRQAPPLVAEAPALGPSVNPVRGPYWGFATQVQALLVHAWAELLSGAGQAVAAGIGRRAGRGEGETDAAIRTAVAGRTRISIVTARRSGIAIAATGVADTRAWCRGAAVVHGQPAPPPPATCAKTAPLISVLPTSWISAVGA